MVGGGFTGLWAALQAKQDDPARDVVVLEAATVAAGASGRNGGFADASLTHGLPNGLSRFPDEIDQLERLGRENLDGIEQAIERHGIDCGWERTGSILVARSRHEVEELSEFVPVMREHGYDCDWLGRDAVRAQVDSPTYLGGIWERSGSAHGRSRPAWHGVFAAPASSWACGCTSCRR